MENMITISNKEISNYVMFKLDKIDNEFTKEELAKITELSLDCQEEEHSNFIPDEVYLFSNLKYLHIRNAEIFNFEFERLLQLKKIEDISFERCRFENANLLASLNAKGLSLINCDINNYSFISILYDLYELSIINGKIESSKINSLKNLTYLQLSYSTLLGDEKNIKLENLKELYIDNTNIDDLEFVDELTNLKKISIDESQYEKNKNLILKLKEKNISVYKENIIEFGDVTNEVRL